MYRYNTTHCELWVWELLVCEVCGYVSLVLLLFCRCALCCCAVLCCAVLCCAVPCCMNGGFQRVWVITLYSEKSENVLSWLFGLNKWYTKRRHHRRKCLQLVQCNNVSTKIAVPLYCENQNLRHILFQHVAKQRATNRDVAPPWLRHRTLYFWRRPSNLPRCCGWQFLPWCCCVCPQQLALDGCAD